MANDSMPVEELKNVGPTIARRLREIDIRNCWRSAVRRRSHRVRTYLREASRGNDSRMLLPVLARGSAERSALRRAGS
jgi:hypothetical protein